MVNLDCVTKNVFTYPPRAFRHIAEETSYEVRVPMLDAEEKVSENINNMWSVMEHREL